MSAHSLFLLHVHKQGAATSCLCFAPFEKGGYGGFAFDLKQKQEQIPLNPPFSKGEAKALPLAAEVSAQVGP
jgi:hypothetical protein